MNLEENIIKYRDITLNIMEMVKAEDYENLEKFFNERQLILDYINKINYSKEELKKLYIKCGIDDLEKKMELEMKVKKEDLLKKMKENQIRKAAMSGYNNLNAKAVFLSKEF